MFCVITVCNMNTLKEDILDRVAMSLPLRIEIIEVTKLQFHKFRENMYRIHKLEMALCCLLYIVLNEG